MERSPDPSSTCPRRWLVCALTGNGTVKFADGAVMLPKSPRALWSNFYVRFLCRIQGPGMPTGRARVQSIWPQYPRAVKARSQSSPPPSACHFRWTNKGERDGHVPSLGQMHNRNPIFGMLLIPGLCHGTSIVVIALVSRSRGPMRAQVLGFG